MSLVNIKLTLQTPEVQEIPRTIEVSCGDSFVTVKQLDGRRGKKWTVYSSDGVGMSGPVMEAPNGATAEDVLPWARERVRLMERERLCFKALRDQLGDAMPPKGDQP